MSAEKHFDFEMPTNTDEAEYLVTWTCVNFVHSCIHFFFSTMLWSYWKWLNHTFLLPTSDNVVKMSTTTLSSNLWANAFPYMDKRVQMIEIIPVKTIFFKWKKTIYQYIYIHFQRISVTSAAFLTCIQCVRWFPLFNYNPLKDNCKENRSHTVCWLA